MNVFNSPFDDVRSFLQDEVSAVSQVDCRLLLSQYTKKAAIKVIDEDPPIVSNERSEADLRNLFVEHIYHRNQSNLDYYKRKLDAVKKLNLQP